MPGLNHPRWRVGLVWVGYRLERCSGAAILQQRRDRLALVKPERTVFGVEELEVRIDAQAVKDRGCQVRGRVGLAGRQSGVAIGLADHAPRLNSTAGEEAGKHVSPMMPPGRKGL